METRDWSKLPEDQKTWAAWKTTFREAYVVKQRAQAAREGEENLLVVPLYSELHLEKPKNKYGGENIKRQRVQARSQIKLWTRWRDI